MNSSRQEPGLGEFSSAIAEDLSGLAELHASELSASALAALLAVDYPQGNALQFSSKDALEASQQLRQAIRGLDREAMQSSLHTLAADYAGIYLNHRYQASPCESVWTNADALSHQEAMFSVRTWYQKHHLQVVNWRICSDDHLVSQLQFIAHLIAHGEKQGLASWDEAILFMDSHLLTWLPRFVNQVTSHCHTQFYATLAHFTLYYLQELRLLLTEAVSQKPCS